MSTTDKPQDLEEEYLTTVSLVSDYLSSAPSVPERFRNPATVTKLSGGAGNFVFRLHLSDGSGTAVLKHSAPFIATWRELEFDIARWDVERQSLRAEGGLLNSVQTEHFKIPELYFADADRKVLIIEDAGENSVSIKELLGREKTVPKELVEALGKEMGVFLAKLHNTTSTPDGKQIREEYKSVFSNESARKMCAWRTFGRIQSSIEKWYTYPHDHGTYEELESLSKKLQEDIMKDSQTMTMGDFWTGNVLVRLHPENENLEAAYVVDWELAHPGDPATDVGQMTAEIYCSHSFASNPENAVAAETLARKFHESYRENAPTGEGFKEKVEIYAGGHVANWAPHVGWSDDKKKLKVVGDKAMKMLWDGYKSGAADGGKGSDGFCSGLAG